MKMLMVYNIDFYQKLEHILQDFHRILKLTFVPRKDTANLQNIKFPSRVLKWIMEESRLTALF